MWLRKTLKEVSEGSKHYQDEAAERFGSEIDICIGNYAEQGKVNREIAVFKWDYTYFMSPDEVKKLKGEKAPPPKLVPPKSFDLTTAERVIITKEELK